MPWGTPERHQGTRKGLHDIDDRWGIEDEDSTCHPAGAGSSVVSPRKQARHRRVRQAWPGSPSRSLLRNTHPQSGHFADLSRVYPIDILKVIPHVGKPVDHGLRGSNAPHGPISASLPPNGASVEPVTVTSAPLLSSASTRDCALNVVLKTAVDSANAIASATSTTPRLMRRRCRTKDEETTADKFPAIGRRKVRENRTIPQDPVFPSTQTQQHASQPEKQGSDERLIVHGYLGYPLRGEHHLVARLRCLPICVQGQSQQDQVQIESLPRRLDGRPYDRPGRSNC